MRDLLWIPPKSEKHDARFGGKCKDNTGNGGYNDTCDICVGEDGYRPRYKTLNTDHVTVQTRLYLCVRTKSTIKTCSQESFAHFPTLTLLAKYVPSEQLFNDVLSQMFCSHVNLQLQMGVLWIYRITVIIVCISHPTRSYSIDENVTCLL